MMPQLAAERRGGVRSNDLAVGMTWFVMGLSKKLLIADPLAPVVQVLYRHPQSFGFTTSWIAVLAYAMQLYFDFSGYSDMALALARMFSIDFPLNFDSPYKATNIIAFWSRWHMTLTRFLTLYIYNPLAMSVARRRIAAGKSVSKKAVHSLEGYAKMIAGPMLATMLVSGIWHGAGLQFLVFGMLHGVYLCINHAWRIFVPKGSQLSKLCPAAVGTIITFLAVLLGQVFFRAQNVADGVYVAQSLIGVHGKGATLLGSPYAASIPQTSAFLLNPVTMTMCLAFCLAIVWLMPNTQEMLGTAGASQDALTGVRRVLRWSPNAAWVLVIVLLFFVSLTRMAGGATFLYFQF
jgi:D-alanyl-lipoteichoic acid acyltransferase DltB (MBOAT superfamily)